MSPVGSISVPPLNMALLSTGYSNKSSNSSKKHALDMTRPDWTPKRGWAVPDYELTPSSSSRAKPVEAWPVRGHNVSFEKGLQRSPYEIPLVSKASKHKRKNKFGSINASFEDSFGVHLKAGMKALTRVATAPDLQVSILDGGPVLGGLQALNSCWAEMVKPQTAPCNTGKFGVARSSSTTAVKLPPMKAKLEAGFWEGFPESGASCYSKQTVAHIHQHHHLHYHVWPKNVCTTKFSVEDCSDCVIKTNHQSG